MISLHELAQNLQHFIITNQQDAHNSRNLNTHRYNNLKLSISSRYNFPNFVVIIGISESVYNLDEVTRISGSLGQDEKFVHKWLGKRAIVEALKELYLNLTELQELKMGSLNIKMQGEAGNVEKENYRKRKLNIPKNDLIIIDEDVLTLLESTPIEVDEETNNRDNF